MNTKLFLLCFFGAATVFAEEPLSQYNSTTLPSNNWNSHAAELDKWFEKRSAPVIVLGKSDFVLSGPIVEQFQPIPESKNLNIGQKFLRLPGVRLLVPKPMESPSETGSYFAWRGESNRPWVSAVGSGAGSGGPANNFINHESQASLISVGR